MVFETNHTLNDGLCNIVKNVLRDKTDITNIEIDETLVTSFQVTKWATNLVDDIIGIRVRVYTHQKNYDGRVDVVLSYGDNLHKLSNQALYSIKKEFDPMLDKMVVTINKERGLKSLINKL